MLHYLESVCLLVVIKSTLPPISHQISTQCKEVLHENISCFIPIPTKNPQTVLSSPVFSKECPSWKKRRHKDPLLRQEAFPSSRKSCGQMEDAIRPGQAPCIPGTHRVGPSSLASACIMLGCALMTIALCKHFCHEPLNVAHKPQVYYLGSHFLSPRHRARQRAGLGAGKSGHYSQSIATSRSYCRSTGTEKREQLRFQSSLGHKLNWRPNGGTAITGTQLSKLPITGVNCLGETAITGVMRLRKLG